MSHTNDKGYKKALLNIDHMHDPFDMTLVWLYQPKLTYFKGKHLVLGLLAIAVTIFYLIPLTVVTLFGDLLRRNCIRSLWFSHFLDVFHGAYCWPLGFWLGLRLLMRVIFLVLQVATNFNTLYTIVFISFCIFFINSGDICIYYCYTFSQKILCNQVFLLMNPEGRI